MYSSQNVKDITSQLQKRKFLLAIPLVLLLAGVVASFLHRVQWLTILLFILCCFVLIFCWGLFLSPLHQYRKFLQSAVHGQNRTMEGYFKRFVDEKSERDGVYFIPLFINISNSGEEEDDRLFYFDANLPLPDWKVGEKLSITSQDKTVISWQRI